MRKLLVLCLLFVAAAITRATPTEPVDLGEGLTYVRLRSLGDDTPVLASAPAKALVIDVRQTSANPETVAAFQAALATRAASAQLFLLVSESTPAVLAPALASMPPKTVTLGTAQAKPTPRVAVVTTPTLDRAAYDAFETGTPLEKLITGKIEKERYDEATLVAEFKNGYALPVAAAEPASPAPTDPAAPAKKAPAESAPATPAATVPTDRVLQRAIHLHRALLALRR